jgi:hypothetical protein
MDRGGVNLAAAAEQAAQIKNLRDQLAGALLTTNQLHALPEPTWVLDQILSRPGVAMLYGPPGTYKTFLATAWALCMATGTPWEADSSYAVAKGSGIYAAAEGAYGLSPRIDAWESWYRTPADNILWCPGPINLLSDLQVKAFIDVATDTAPAFVFLDTYARCTVGGDENSAKDAGVAVDHLSLMSRKLDANVLVVHHSRKDGGDYRGSSAILGAVDTAIEVTADGMAVTVRCTKQKDAAPFHDIELEMFPVGASLCHRGGGTTTTGLDRADDLLDLLCQMCATGAASTALLKKTAESELQIPPRSFYRLMEGLVRKGFASNIGSDKRALFMPTAMGTAVSCATRATSVPCASDTAVELCRATTTSLEVAQGTNRGTNNGASKPRTSADDLL